MSWKLGNIGYESVIPTPDEFSINPVKIKRQGRTASGRLVTDIIAIKKQFTLKYNILTSEEVQQFVSEFNKPGNLSFIYMDGGVENTAIVDFASLPRDMALENPEYWENVTITLEEV